MVSKDTQRCFRTNPLLRYTHRKLAKKVLAEFQLEAQADKSINLSPNIDASKLAWLEFDSTFHFLKEEKIVETLPLKFQTSLNANEKS